MTNAILILVLLFASTIGCRGVQVDSPHAHQTSAPVPTPDLGPVLVPPPVNPLERANQSRRITAEDVLDESEAAGSKLQEPENRAAFLIELCRVSVEVKSLKAKQRCIRAHEFARDHLKGCDSEKEQVKALKGLSNVDAVKAFKLLRKVSTQCERRE